MSYRNNTEEGRREAALKRNHRRNRKNFPKDKNVEYGPPDHSYNIDLTSASTHSGTKRPAASESTSEMDDFMPPTKKVASTKSVVYYDYLGRNIKMRFKTKNGLKW